MTAIRDLNDLIASLRGFDQNDLISCAERLLRSDVDWAGVVLKAITGFSTVEFAHRATLLRVPGVQPWPFALHVEPEQYSVVLNHYDKTHFVSSFEQGNITPHIHHFSFCSLVLRGSLFEMLFANDGTDQEPRLRNVTQKRHKVGDVFTLYYPEFHCVIEADDDTVTLMIRSRPLFSNPHISATGVDAEIVARQRQRIEQTLRGIHG